MFEVINSRVLCLQAKRQKAGKASMAGKGKGQAKLVSQLFYAQKFHCEPYLSSEAYEWKHLFFVRKVTSIQINFLEPNVVAEYFFPLRYKDASGSMENGFLVVDYLSPMALCNFDVIDVENVNLSQLSVCLTSHRSHQSEYLPSCCRLSCQRLIWTCPFGRHKAKGRQS